MGVADTTESQFSELSLVPPIHPWWFADHDRPIVAHETPGLSEGELRRPEPSGDDGVEGFVRAEGRDVRTRHRDPVLPAQPADQPFEGIGTFRPAIEQRQSNSREIMRDDQTRHATATAQIEDGLDHVFPSLESSDEPAGVRDHLRDRA